MPKMPQPADLVLVVRQPWAWAIFNAGKNIECRLWRPSYRGRIWLLAGRSIEPPDESWNKIVTALHLNILPFGDMLRGYIVGSVTIGDCVTRTELNSNERVWADNHEWFWRLQEPEVLETPIKCKGFLGLFRFSSGMAKRERKPAAKKFSGDQG